jgi:SAM-dependent methyltransferase
MTDRFADHFSTGSGEYATFRPRYPEALFAWLASRAPRLDLAWDCATGTGQAATGLAAHFSRVIATDASGAQLAEAERDPRVEYRRALADASGLENESASLVTVAQALHWLPLDRFWVEARRVLVPGGLLAAWGYALPRVSASVDPLVVRLHGEIAGPYWPAGREIVDTGYRSIVFPFPEIDAPAFIMEQRLTRDRFVGYLRTWSAVRRYAQACGRDPVAEVLPALEAAWPADESRLVLWPLFVRAGFKPSEPQVVRDHPRP